MLSFLGWFLLYTNGFVLSGVVCVVVEPFLLRVCVVVRPVAEGISYFCLARY